MSDEHKVKKAKPGIFEERKKIASSKSREKLAKKAQSERLKRIDLFANTDNNILKRVAPKPVKKEPEKNLEKEQNIKKRHPQKEFVRFVRNPAFEKIDEQEELDAEENNKTAIKDLNAKELKEKITDEDNLTIEEVTDAYEELPSYKKYDSYEEKIDEFLEKIKLDPIEEIKPEVVEIIEEEEVIEASAPDEQIGNILDEIKTAEKAKDELTNRIREFIQVKYETIQNKATKLLVFCNHFENENRALEQQVIQVIRESFERIDEIKDTVRRESLMENEIGYKLQKLKTKVMELDEANNRIGKYLNDVDGQYTEIGLLTIKELEHKQRPLEYQNKAIENQYFSLMQEQSELTGTLSFKTRILRITRADRESDFKKLHTHYKILEERKKEILERLEYAKAAMHENTVSETNKHEKLTEELRVLTEKSKFMLREKVSLENENNYLKEKIRKILEELE